MPIKRDKQERQIFMRNELKCIWARTLIHYEKVHKINMETDWEIQQMRMRKDFRLGLVRIINKDELGH